MKVEWRTEPGSRAVLEIEVPEDEVARAMDRAYTSLAQRVQVPGFRPGKAPRDILERHIGTEALREEALRRLIPDAYADAVTQAGIAPIARPSIEVKEGGAGKGVHLTATVDVYPQVTLPDYRSLRVARDDRSVTNEDVERALEDIRARHGRLASAGGEAARRGDFVLLTVAAAPPGLERLQPGKELLVEVGGGLLPDAVETVLEGARAGESRTGHVEGAGDVTVQITDVRRKELPPLDDALAQAASNQPTLAALREGLRARLRQERAVEEARDLRDRVLDAVADKTTIDLPESLVQHEVEHVMEDLESRLRSRGLTLASYLSGSGKEEATLRTELRAGAERRVRTRLLLDAVAEREALAVSEEEMTAEVKKLADELHQDVAKVRAWLSEGGRSQSLRESVLRQKAMVLLMEVVSGVPAREVTPEAVVAESTSHTPSNSVIVPSGGASPAGDVSPGGNARP